MAVKFWSRGTVSFFFTKVALAAFVLFGMAATSWAQPSFPWTYPVVRSGAYDFNGDGVKDLVWQRWSGETDYVLAAAGQLTFWMMGGSPAPQPTQFVTLSADPMADLSGVGDFDGDGKADLVWRNTVTGDVVIWLMDSGTVKSSVTVVAGLDKVWQILGVGDLDGDSRADLIWRYGTRGDVAAWLLDGASVKAWATLLPALDPVNWRLVGIGDLDGDGKADLIWWNPYQSGDVVAWMMDGLTVRSWGTVFRGLGWKLSAVADLDGDTKADLVWRNFNSGDVEEWLMDALAVKDRATLYRRLDQSWQITGAGDLDGDGRADLIWRHVSSSEHAEWMMDSSIIKGWSWIKPEGTVSFQSTVSDQVEVSSFSILVYQWPGSSFQSIAPLIRLRNKSSEVGLNIVRIDFDLTVGWNLLKRIEIGPGASRDLVGLAYGDWEIELWPGSTLPDTLGVTISFVDQTGRGGTITARAKIGDSSPNRIDPGWISR